MEIMSTNCVLIYVSTKHIAFLIITYFHRYDISINILVST
jgi:hypothetical protein